MEFINDTKKKQLNFVLCGYDGLFVYHEYLSEKGILDAGTPLTTNAAKEIFKSINQVEDFKPYCFKSIIPRNVLTFKTDKKYIIWHSKAEIKKVLYKSKIVKSGEYYIPRMLWKLEENNLSVWALKSNFKNEKDKLYNAPLFNISSNGSVCMGNTKYCSSDYDYSKLMSVVETAFWESYFTHSNNNQLLSINFSEWANNKGLRIKPCESLLIESTITIKEILK